MNIRLAEVNKGNWDEVTCLKVFDEQDDFVASNTYSLAEASFNPECVPLAIYNGDDLVGFMMYHVP